MECQPISSLEELLSWQKEDTHRPNRPEISPVAAFDNCGAPAAGDRAPRLLLCHDMKGGYIEDRFCAGHNDPSAYTFWHWPRVHEFVYFSHQFVTVPPCGWVDAAHAHGVPVYGTVITEGDDGAALCHQLLASADSVDAAVEQLVAVSAHRGIDGWLVNIENSIPAEQVPLLVRLLALLTERMHAARPCSRVLWYDAVTADGRLSWQNELNQHNQCYFSVCDGIFLNYCWRPEQLVASAERAGARSADVYAGVDVFGRGCLGNGGFNCTTPVAAARRSGVSAALFAPGWTHERLGAARFPLAEAVLWTRLSRLLGARGPARLPLTSTFCAGRGRRHFRRGQVVKGAPWHCLSEQSLLPTYLQTPLPDDLPLTDADLRPLSPELQSADTEPPQPGWTALLTDQDAFCGGGALALTNRANTDALYRLWVCDLAVDGPLSVTLAVKATSECDGGDRCAICLLTESPYQPDSAPRRHFLVSAAAAEAEGESRFSGATVHQPLTTAAELEPEPAHNGWTERQYRLCLHSTFRVTSLAVHLPVGDSVLLGLLDIRRYHCADVTCDAPVSAECA